MTESSFIVSVPKPNLEGEDFDQVILNMRCIVTKFHTLTIIMLTSHQPQGPPYVVSGPKPPLGVSGFDHTFRSVICYGFDHFL